MKNNPTTFAQTILNWHTTVDRNLPWKSTKDPYKIWLSEIILQQTRVAQGTPYYLRFVDNFPTVNDLANAEESKIMKLWQGLGYYSRARNLHYAAKTIRDRFNGQFPTEYDKILSLKGVGKYTAAAISSFAFDLSYPVVDGNVIRLISRYYGITEPVDTSKGQKTINEKANQLIAGSNPASYNQAIMDFGALMCTPKSPNCIECPLSSDCVAYAKGQVAEIPMKSKKLKKKTRYFHYLYIKDVDHKLLLNFRAEKDIWKSLHDFPMIENNNDTFLSKKAIKAYVSSFLQTKIHNIKIPTKKYKHILSHQTIFGMFYKIEVQRVTDKSTSFLTVHQDQIENYAMPVLLTNYLKEREIPSLF